MNAAHSSGVNTNAGPVGCLLSRTATASWSLATSTQLPLAPLRVLLRHVTAPRSGAFTYFHLLGCSHRPTGRPPAASRPDSTPLPVVGRTSRRTAAPPPP